MGRATGSSYSCLLGVLGILLTIWAQAHEPPSFPAATESTARIMPTDPITSSASNTKTPRAVYIIPIQGEVTPPVLYILRRGLKEAIAQNIETVVLNVDTPGGRLDITLDIIEALNHFEGETLTYINKEAISAGAYISAATQHIYFAPKALIGAAAVVSGTGQDVDPTLKQKVDSYLRAKIRSLSDIDPYRANVVRAMLDADFVFEIDGQVLKKEGELLTLTAEEAMVAYGKPPRPLLGSGVFNSITDLLDTRYGAGLYTIRDFEVTWSERLAQWFNPIAPILFGIGILCLFIEFKTPGFGIVGILGGALIGVFFISQHIAGLAGHEPMIAFTLGLSLIAAELFLLPGTVFLGIVGALLMLSSLLWAMVDYWPSPQELPNFHFSIELFIDPLIRLGLGLAVALGGSLLVLRLLPKSRVGSRLILKGTVELPNSVELGSGNTPPSGMTSLASKALPTKGSKGVTITDLHPSGEVEIAGCRYQASVTLGTLPRGTPIIVTGQGQFHLLVEEAEA